MKTILVLGTGCAKCRKLTEDVEAVVREMGLDAEVSKVTDMAEMMRYGILTTPALVLDGEVLVAGRAPSRSELKAMLA